MRARSAFALSMATLALAALAVVFGAAPAHAQSPYPVKPVRVLVGAPPGSGSDVIMRIAALKLGERWNRSVVIDNRAGALGAISLDIAAQAAPDGYTLLLHHIGMSTAPALYRTLRYNAVDSFEPIGLIADVPMTLVGKPGLAARDFKEFLAYIKANKATVTYANAGIGSASHLCGMLFMSAIETDVTTVPYKGTGSSHERLARRPGGLAV